MRNLTNVFRTGLLRPKERVLIQVHNMVAKDRTGKEMLSEADIHALGEGWHPLSSDDAREYNRYIGGWRLIDSAALDAQTTYLVATAALLRASRPIDMTVLRDGEKALTYCKTFSKEHLASGENALGLILKNSGLELDQVVHRYAFESLSEDMKQDVLALDPDAGTESQYLNQEEALADLFNGKRELSKEAKEKLADLIVTSLHNKYADLFRKLDADSEFGEEYVFSSYYSELPALEILIKWAFYNGQMPKEAEDKEYANEGEEVADLFSSIRKELTPRLSAYAEKYQTSTGELLRETLLRWLDDGLFIKDFAPLCNSKSKDTCNGVATKRPHKEVLEEWLKAKRSAREAIHGLIDSGELMVENRVETINRFVKARKAGFEGAEAEAYRRDVKLITGESLYALEGDYAFANDYRKQADDLEGLGGMILFLRGRSFLNDYGVLLEFIELFKRLSEIYEVDLTYRLTSWLPIFKDDVEMLNSELMMIAETIRQASHEKHGIAYPIEVFVDDMLIELDQVERSRGPTEHYYNELEQQFGGRFQLYE